MAVNKPLSFRSTVNGCSSQTDGSPFENDGIVTLDFSMIVQAI